MSDFVAITIAAWCLLALAVLEELIEAFPVSLVTPLLEVE